MDERAALRMLESLIDSAGDDAAVVDGTLFTIDMLHERTDFPDGTTRYTAGWRSIGVSISDLAAMGGRPLAAVAAYGAPSFSEAEIHDFIRGCLDICESVGGEYVGGDLDEHAEFTVATAAVGAADRPIYRSGARPNDRLCVSGTLGRTAAAIRLFESDPGLANELFRFSPRIDTGRAVGPYGTAMIDSSDGFARSVHQIAEASGCGFEIDGARIPVHESLREVTSEAEARELAMYFGEDFELIFTIPPERLGAVSAAAPIPITAVGTVVDEADGVLLDGKALANRGYTHGGD